MRPAVHSPTVQQRLDLLEQFVGSERLREVGVGAGFHPALDVGLLHPCRQQHHLQVAQLVVRAERGQHLGPGAPRHHHVEDGQRRPERPRELERLVAVVRLHDLVAGAAQPERHEGQDVLVVVGAEDERLGIAHTAAGSSTKNVVPPASPLRTPILPPCDSTIALEM